MIRFVVGVVGVLFAALIAIVFAGVIELARQNRMDAGE